MAEKYILKNSPSEAVIKVYATSSSGGTVDVALSELAENGETVSAVHIKEIFWSMKPNKSAEVSRVDGSDLEGTYHLSQTGHWHFNTFNDETYPGLPLRFVFDGYGTIIIRIRKILTT
jgi:hypothetical protein